MREIEIREFLDAFGRSPFARWFEGLNAVAAARVTKAEAPGSDAPEAEKPRDLAGRILEVRGTVVIVLPEATQAREVGLETNARTAVTVDGKEAEVADLRPGMKVTITWGIGMEPRVAATTR